MGPNENDVHKNSKHKEKCVHISGSGPTLALLVAVLVVVLVV
jgi:hypothetical protein